MRTKFCKSNFLGKGFRKTSANSFLKFGGVSDLDSARRKGLGGNARGAFLAGAKNSEYIKFKIVSVFLSLCGCPCLKGMHPRHPPRAFPLWLLAPRCLCAGKQIAKRLKYQKMSRLLDCPLFLGRGSFLSPGRAIYSSSTRNTPSPSPLYVLHIYVRGVAFATKLL
jgi:hypothetical protein